jgi:hypothetical protein
MAETAEDKERAARAADEAAAAWADRLHNPKTAARFTRLAVQLRREAAALRGAVGDLTCQECVKDAYSAENTVASA